MQLRASILKMACKAGKPCPGLGILELPPTPTCLCIFRAELQRETEGERLYE